jgi:hypothetical protein
VQLYDLDTAGLARVGEAAFLTLQTSPGNHQAWVAVSDLADAEAAKDFARRLREGAGNGKVGPFSWRSSGTTLAPSWCLEVPGVPGDNKGLENIGIPQKSKGIA